MTGRVFCRSAVLYYDQYMLRFTDDEQSLSSTSNEPEWLANNMNSILGIEAALRLMERVVTLMNSMADLATSSSSSRSYATGEVVFGDQGIGTVYGMLQCTLDLTGPQCKSCLGDIIRQIVKLFSNITDHQAQIGGRIIGVRCNLRFEKELFFEEDTIKIDMPKSTCCFTAYNLHLHY